MDLPSHLAPLLEVLRRTFPAGVDSDQRDALLATLWSELAEENFGMLMSEYFDDEQVVIVNEAIRALGAGISPAAMSEIMASLVEAGWPNDPA